MGSISVSAIITTKNSEKTLEQLLISLKEQTYQKMEIILVDNNSTDQTCQIAKKYTNKVYQKGPERSAQRNFGAKKAIGEFLFFLDSDMYLSKNVVWECVNFYQKKSSKIWGGLVIPEQSIGQGFWSRVKAFERALNAGEPFFEAARFYPQEVFWEASGYDKSLTGPEDWDLPQRIQKKYQLGRIKAKIYHQENNPSPVFLARKKYYYGLSVHRYLTKQNLPIFGPTTVYFLRKAFYKNWRKLLENPVLTLGMFFMLMAETVGGGVGYLVGRFNDES